jgi:hypothetical protein
MNKPAGKEQAFFTLSFAWLLARAGFSPHHPFLSSPDRSAQACQVFFKTMDSL